MVTICNDNSKHTITGSPSFYRGAVLSQESINFSKNAICVGHGNKELIESGSITACQQSETFYYIDQNNLYIHCFYRDEIPAVDPLETMNSKLLRGYQSTEVKLSSVREKAPNYDGYYKSHSCHT